MRDFFLLPPDYQSVPWDPARLKKMRRVLEADRHPSWLTELRYHLAYCLFGRNNKIKVFFCKPEEIPEEELQGGRSIGALRQWLGQLVAPKQPPQPQRFNLFVIDRKERLRRGAVLNLRQTDPAELFLDDERLEEPILIREWRLIRYAITEVPVDRDLADGDVEGTEWEMGDPSRPGHRLKLRISFRKQGNEEALIFSERRDGDEGPTPPTPPMSDESAPMPSLVEVG